MKIINTPLKLIFPSPLTFKLVEEVLKEIISNEEDVKSIIKAIKNKREKKYVYDIRRTYT